MKTVFVDVDTQLDFMFPAGALYVPGAERLLPAFKRLNRHAAARGIPVVSTMDAHLEDDPEFRVWPPHCVLGTAGQQKPADTLLERRAVIPVSAEELAFDGAQQILVHKRNIDVYAERNVRRVLELLDADLYVVYGLVTEYCVRAAALGLQKAGKRVVLVTDAIQALDAEAARRTFDEFAAGGGTLTTVEQVCLA